MASCSIAVLGPVEVRGEHGPIDLGGGRQRRLLAALSANAHDVVSVERLADIVWQGEPSEAAKRTLQSYVSRLRRSLEAAGVAPGSDPVRLAEPGYMLDVDDRAIDATAFEHLLADAIAAGAGGDPARAVVLLDEADQLWRGPAYAEFADEDWVRPEVQRLEELHAVAIEERVDARLALGAHAEVVAELEQLVFDQPLRERPRRQLMLAMYRSGRQAESLRAYQAYRQLLADELGLEPSDELRDLEERVARNDPDLAFDPTAGRSLRGYQLFEQLGSGAFATVFRGTQPSVGREVAIKVIRSELANRPEFIRKFEAEAQLVAYLEHPHIVPLYDFWREPDRAYLVMRLMRGGRLETRLTTRPLSVRETRVLVTQIGDALAYSHRAGVVHRDVKPPNVLLDGDGNYYLGDFGIATGLSGDSSDEVVSASLSPAYASPEQLRRQPVGYAADIFGFGVTIFEALTGTLPFDGPDGAEDLVGETEARILPPVSSRRPGLSSEIDAVLRRATASEPGDRHPDMLSFVTEILVALDDDPGVATRVASDRDIGVRAPSAINPYKGLRAFGEADAADFHGRDDLVAAMVSKLNSADTRPRLVTVVGPSGSGKSSVVRAGLIPAVRKGDIPGSADWFVTTMTPGASPFFQLEAALLRVAVNPPEQLLGQLRADEQGIARSVRRVLPDEQTRLLLVIDQFEELFVVAPEDVRRSFLEALAVAVTDTHSPLRVVATLRADFYDRPLSHREFADLTKASAVTVTPLAPDELERAIVAPAHAAGVDFEPGLVPEIVADTAHSAGALPLLQYALTELYERRSEDTITRASYHELGGAVGALSSRADELVQAMSSSQQETARRLFSRLVTIGEGAADTRRRVTRSELGYDNEMGAVIETLGAARLLSFDRDAETREPTVEVAHEALITQWPTLRRWIDTDREGLRLHHHLTVAASEWEEAARDPGELYRGGRLQGTIEWAGTHHLDLNPAEREFLDASAELHQAELDRESRRVRRLRLLLAGVGVVAVIAIVAGFVAFRASETADENAQSARARELGIAAINELETDPELGLLLALEAASVDEEIPSEVVDALHQSLQALRVEFTVTAPGGPGLSAAGGAAFSPDGALLATTGNGVSIAIWDGATGEQVTTFGPEPERRGTFPEVAWYGPDEVVAWGGSSLEVWNVTTGERRLSSSAPATQAGTIATSPEAQRIVTAGFGDAIRVWDAGSGEELLQTRPAPSAWGVAIDPTGTLLVAMSDNPIARLYDMSTLDELGEFVGHTDGGIDATISPDGGRVVTTSNDGTARVWSLDDQQELLVFNEHTGGVVTAEFSPDGELVATAGNDGRVLIWEVDRGAVQLELTGHHGQLGQLSWHPNGRELAVASGGGITQVFDISAGGSREVLTIEADPGGVGEADLSPDGMLIATVGSDQTARIFAADSAELIAEFPPSGEVLPSSDLAFSKDEGLRFSPDGTMLAVFNDRGVVVWDVASGMEVTRLAEVTARVHGVDWSADGTRIATVGTDAFVRTWSVGSGEQLASAENGITAVAFASEGDRLVTGTFFGLVRLWAAPPGEPLRTVDLSWSEQANAVTMSPDGSMVAGAHRAAIASIWDLGAAEPRILQEPNDSNVLGVAFSPDSQLLATVGEGGSIGIWDAITGERQQSLAGHEGRVQSVVFAPDGNTVLTAGEDGTVRVHLVDVPDLLELAESRVTRQFTQRECTQFRLDGPRCPAPADEATPDDQEPGERTDPAAASAALDSIADAIGTGDVDRALAGFDPAASLGGWIIDTGLPTPGAFTGQLSDAETKNAMIGGFEAAAVRDVEMRSIQCGGNIADGPAACSYTVDGWVDPTRELNMNVEIEMRDGLITSWFNLAPGGSGYDDLLDLQGFLWERSGQASDADLQECLEIQLNDPACVETVGPYLDEFRALRAAES